MVCERSFTAVRREPLLASRTCSKYGIVVIGRPTEGEARGPWMWVQREMDEKKSCTNLLLAGWGKS